MRNILEIRNFKFTEQQIKKFKSNETLIELGIDHSEYSHSTKLNDLTLLNLVSSRANKKDMMDSLNNLWRMASYYDQAYGYKRIRWEDRDKMGQEIPVADNFTLYSTPLNQSIVVAMDLVPKFKKDNGLQKVHTVFLTDGYSNSLDRKYV